MFWFEIHMTADENIHEMAKKFDHKTIRVELLRPDMSAICLYDNNIEEDKDWMELYELF
jgi:hypothetical protein